MRTCVGIELSPVACRIVELDGGRLEPGGTTRVRSYALLPPAGPETDARLAELARRSVAVVVWGAHAEHHQVVVPKGSYEKMRAEALTAIRTEGIDTQGMLADVTTASTAIRRAKEQPVVLVLANGSEVSAALAPIVAARARIRSVITPADALLGLARSRQAFAIPGGIEAYVAMDQTATCLALVRDGSLLRARELPWGYVDWSGEGAATPPQAEPRRGDLAGRLIDELARLLPAVGGAGGELTQLAICGGLPELRTMTVTLMERLDVEVETLDSLFGIDAEHLPEPAEDFRERASELRLAWAAAADWNGPVNLMRHRVRRNRRALLARAAVVGGVAAGLGAGWAVQRSQWWQSTTAQSVARQTSPTGPPPRSAPPPPTAASPPARPLPVAPPSTIAAPSGADARATPPLIEGPPAPALPRPPNAAPPPAPTGSTAPVPRPAPLPAPAPPPPRPAPPAPLPPRPLPPPAVVTAAPSPSAARPAAPSSASSTSAPPPTPRPAPPVPVTARPLPPPVVVTAAPPSSALRTAAPAAAQPPVPAAPPLRGTQDAAPVDRPTAAPARRLEPPPLPFDAVLGTILYSADRKLAIVNARIVGLGDEVNGARIVDITPTTVLLRDARGRMRILAVGQATPTPATR